MENRARKESFLYHMKELFHVKNENNFKEKQNDKTLL